MKRFFAVFLALLLAAAASAHPYSGERAFDGTHRHVMETYLMGGYNVVTDGFVGEAFAYTHHFTDRWSLSAAEQVQFFKQLYSLDLTGTYRLPAGRCNLYFDGRVLLNNYGRWGINEPILHLSMLVESPYVDFRVGASLIHYWKTGVDVSSTSARYTEPVAIPVGLGINIRRRSNPWNVGIFLRNYDQFYFENWNINWGIRFHATLREPLKLFGEFNVRPAGSLSQIATRYETSAKLGIRYAL